MLVSARQNKYNQIKASLAAIFVVVVGLVLTVTSWKWIALLPMGLVVYWVCRRKTKRRLLAASKPFPDAYESALQTHVLFFRSLEKDQQVRFRRLMQVFLSEVDITGIRTEVDDTTRALVAASAVIPIFGFDDWEYAGLGEVLIYPGRYDANFETDGDGERNILGMVGTGHLSGVMILSKPDLISGFGIQSDKRNVGIHEFSHLVDKADGSVDGIPAGIPASAVKPWIDWVGRELRSEKTGGHHIDDYAYTNEAEYFAVLSEYFFETPAALAKKNPKLFAMMQKLYRQDPTRLLRARAKTNRIGRNASCPCGSGRKYKRCCRSTRSQ